MADDAVRKTMRANRSKDTGPEIALRRMLWANGMRGYRKHVARLPGKPDVAWIGRKVALFLNGCFWHGCPRCTARGRTPIPKANAEYWTAKRQRNIERQETVLARLHRMGWHTMVVWECELRTEPEATLRAIQKLLEPAERP